MVFLFMCHKGVVTKCSYTCGGIINGPAIRFTSSSCVCARQALALLVFTNVGFLLQPIVLLVSAKWISANDLNLCVCI